MEVVLSGALLGFSIHGLITIFILVYLIFSHRLWSTPDPELIKLFHAIYLDDMQQVQTCLEQNMKCHPLCDCDNCASGDKLLMMKDNLRCWTPLSLASWLGKFWYHIQNLCKYSVFQL